MTYEYGLRVWGGYFQTAGAVAAGHREGTYFFPDRVERDRKLDELRVHAHANPDCTGFGSDGFEGEDARYRTIASMVFVVGGVRYPLEYDFGFGYEDNAEHYMFEDGNYACDCNRALFLRRIYGDIPGLPADGEDGPCCGNTIHMEDFSVRRERGQDGAWVPPEEETVRKPRAVT